MRIFSAKEIFNFALRIEENGKKFYNFAATLTENNELKDTFHFLASEEERHKKIFKEMLSEISGSSSPEEYSDEYFDYLKCYVDNIIFTDKQMDEKVSGIDDVPSAIDFAIKRELDSILYYHEVKKFIPEKQHANIEKIIEEERKHYRMLNDLKEDYK